MKQLLIRLFFIIICCIFLTNCSKNELSNYVRFSNTTAQVSAVSDTIMIRVEWSHVQWSISPEGRSFITGFLVTSGGDISKSDSHTDITVNLDHNLTTSTRSRNIIVTNISTGETTKISIVQNAGMAVSMTIDPALIYQKVTGFGGMLNPTIWVGAVNQITLAETEKMYSQTGLGYNIIRMMV